MTVGFDISFVFVPDNSYSIIIFCCTHLIFFNYFLFCFYLIGFLLTFTVSQLPEPFFKYINKCHQAKFFFNLIIYWLTADPERSKPGNSVK